MSRAAFLPFPGDPFLLHYWFTFYDRFWSNEVDKLYVYLNSPVEKPIVEYIQSECLKRKNVDIFYHPWQMEHGHVLDKMLESSTEEFIMFIEDDGFIFKPGQVDKCFRWLESGEYDIVGSKRGSCSMEILSRASQLWGINYTGEGDQGCNFWPNFFFTKRQKLLATDRNFAGKSWKRGEEIVPLSRPGDTYLAQDEIVTSDTFVNGSLQLQASTNQMRIKYVPQYHGAPEDLDHATRGYNLFDGLAPWCHVGSLSSGVGGLLQDGHGRSLARRSVDPDKGNNIPLPNYCHTEQEKWEFERRVQWWLTFYQNREIGKIDDFAQLYLEAIDRIINQYELSRSRIDRRQRIYTSIGL